MEFFALKNHFSGSLNSTDARCIYKHLVSKACSSRHLKGEQVFGSRPSKEGLSKLGIVHKSNVFVHSSSGRKNLLRTSLFCPFG